MADWVEEQIVKHEWTGNVDNISYGQILVRCKDCEHCYFASNRIPSEQNYACGKHGFDVAPDWFCADGEKAVSE